MKKKNRQIPHPRNSHIELSRDCSSWHHMMQLDNLLDEQLICVKLHHCASWKNNLINHDATEQAEAEQVGCDFVCVFLLNSTPSVLMMIFPGFWFTTKPSSMCQWGKERQAEGHFFKWVSTLTDRPISYTYDENLNHWFVLHFFLWLLFQPAFSL